MIYYGADYYPEQWPEERWPVDSRLMREAGFNVVRLAEFAWSRLEPAPGNYQFDWLDRAIEVLAGEGLKIVLGTPSASPPPWLMAAYPSAFIVRADGRVATYGSRREYCPTHPDYSQHSTQIVQAMAEHYGQQPAVIGWQIDNEFGERCYCPNCQRRFQDWLCQRFGTLEALNQRWGTVFWSHEYSHWSQIPLPWTTSGIPNPGLALDYARFMSEMYVAFQQAQVDILRVLCPDHFITHNLMGFNFDQLDYHALAKSLDFVSWDNYPRGFWLSDQDIDPAGLALGHDTMRGLKNRGFWVMEAQSGPAGWDTVGVTPRPGEMRLWAYQAMAHGGDGIVFFRWRSARFGAEQYWHGILDHSGRAGRRYQEAKRLGAELERIGGDIAGAEVRPQAAMILSYDARFAFQIQPNNKGFSYSKHFRDYYQALHRQNVPAAVVSPLADLSPYRLVIAPALYVMDEAIAANLRRFVEGGGVLIVTSRSGVKAESNEVVNMPLPGLLAELCGVEVVDYDSLLPGIARELMFVAPSLVVSDAASIWCDMLETKTARVLARYTQDYFAGQPAVTAHDVGLGQAIYVGSIGNGTLAREMTHQAIERAGLRPLLTTPARVEVTARWQGERRLLFVLNHNTHEQTIHLDGSYRDVISGEIKNGAVRLPEREALILVEE
jgi:beta-galactosidase